jgi:NAD dependent epimerase/dehydratase family enzyme
MYNFCFKYTKAYNRRYVLVTGATGFIGAHVVDNLLARGFSVRGSTRSKAKGDQMKAARPEYASKLDFVVVEDFTKIGVFDSVMDGIDAVIHVASVCHLFSYSHFLLSVHSRPNTTQANPYPSHSSTTPPTTNKNSSCRQLTG